MSHKTLKYSNNRNSKYKIKTDTIIYMMQLHFVMYIPSKAYTIDIKDL